MLLRISSLVTALCHSATPALFVLCLIAIFAASPALAAEMIVLNPEDQDKQRFVRAMKYLNLGQKSLARVELEALADKKDFILADYIAYDLASIALENGEYQAAYQYLEAAAQALEGSPLEKESARISILAHCGMDIKEEACAKALRESGKKDIPKDFIPHMLLLMAQRAQAMDDPKLAYNLYMKVQNKHPEVKEAELAEEEADRLRKQYSGQYPKSFQAPSYQENLYRVNRLNKAFKYKKAADLLERMIEDADSQGVKASLKHMLGSALYNARLRERAKKVFLEFARDYPAHEKRQHSEYYIAMIDWNHDRDSECKTRMKNLAFNGNGEYKGLAYYILGRMAESKERYAEAEEMYSNAVENRLPSRFKSDAWWRLGWIKYSQGQFADAGRIFNTGAKKSFKRYDNGRFWYWSVKSFENAGDSEGLLKAQGELSKNFPYTYYGLAGQANAAEAYAEPGTIADVQLAEGLDFQPPEKLSKEAERRLERIYLLIEADQPRRAEKELDLAGKEAGKSRQASLWLAGMYVRAGAPARAIAMFSGEVNGQDAGVSFADEKWRLVYPVNHWDKITREAKRAGIDPLLALAVIRQESAFDEKALSPANAIGLMQIIPKTGQKMYKRTLMSKRLGVPFSRELLYDPEVNIALGIAYLSGLLKRYDGQVAPVLAAYNAGESAVDKWLKRFGQMPQEEFIEVIPYSETREYVKKVLRNLVIYRSIYSEMKAGAKLASKTPEAI